MAESDLFFYSIIGFFVGIYFFFKGFTLFKQKRMIEHTPTSKVRSIAMGPVEVFGEIIPSERGVMKSPLTGKDCVYYKYTVEEYRGGKNKHWAVIRKGEESKPFFLNDDTAAVLVDAKGAQVQTAPDMKFESNMLSKLPENVVNFMNTSGINFKGIFGINRQLRFTEKHIAPGEKLYIMGTAGDNPYVEEGSAKNNAEDIMIQKGGRNNFYYISDKPEKEVVEEFSASTYFSLLGGPVLSVVCLAIILKYIGIL